MTEDKKCKPSNGVLTEGRENRFGYFGEGDQKPLRLEKTGLLLHSCCGPCSTSVIERLARQYKITVYFYNPNITHREEYLKRKETQIQFIESYNLKLPPEDHITFLEGPYDTESFLDAAKGMEEEPEGGKRCTACFWLRLEKTAETARLTGNDCFATTLAVSPRKNFLLITRIGQDLALRYGLTYIAEDFRKKAGYQRSVEMAREYRLYRQRFCGCEYSRRPDPEEQEK